MSVEDENMECTEEDCLASEEGNQIPKQDEEPETLIPVPEELKLENMTEKQKARERRQIMKNVLIIAIGWLMVMSAWGGLSRMQSSLNRVEGMGTINVSILHAALTLSNLLLPKIVINLIGCKFAIVLGLFTYALWAAANGYAVWATMVPVSILVGLASAPMWTAQRTYYTLFANRYALLAKEEPHTIISRFIGIFFACCNLGGITGSIISTTVLRQPENNISEEALQYCGMNDCPWNNVSNPNIEKPPQSTVWTMLIAYLSIAVAGLLVLIILLDQLPKWLIKKEKHLKKQTLHHFSGTAKQIINKKQIALIPITMYAGFEQGALGAEFTKSYVTCTVGIWMIGSIMIPYAVTHACASLAIGRMVKYTGRKPLVILGFMLDITIQVTLMTWKPTPSQAFVLYIIVIMWGMSDSIWQNQIPSLYAVIFENTISAFAVNGLWGALGWVIAFGYSSYLCTSVKLYILMSIQALSAVGYFLTEFWCYKEDKEKKSTNKENEKENTNFENGESIKTDS